MTRPAPSSAPQSIAAEERAAVTAALLEATAHLVGQADALATIQSMCEGVVAATPHIRLAWAWFGHPDTREIRPLVAAGPAKAYADTLVIERHLLTSMDPAVRALRSQETDASAVARLSLYGPWRAASKTYGFEVAAAFPLHVPNARKRGLLVFYADNADYFERVGEKPFDAFARLAEATLAQAELRAKLHRKATHDALTGLHNRGWLTDELEKTHANAERYGHRYALMMFDLDGFKAINDRAGHAAGDRALATAAVLAKEETRRGDVNRTLGRRRISRDSAGKRHGGRRRCRRTNPCTARSRRHEDARGSDRVVRGIWRGGVSRCGNDDRRSASCRRCCALRREARRRQSRRGCAAAAADFQR
jgi:hypothetical protein